MDKRILWFDVETGGTDEKTDALLQLAALIEINGEVVDEINLKMQPIKGKRITEKSIEKHGMTLDVISDFEFPHSCYGQFNRFLYKHNPTPVKTNRYIMAGYNADFDCRFLSQWYADISGGPFEYWKHCQFSPLDILPTLRAMRYAGVLKTEDTKLETVCNYFGIEIQAHDALSDIRATRELNKLVFGRLWTGWTGQPHGILGPIAEEVTA
ncbi:MAG: 3'-5' exonuclease [Fibrobacterota bacterium]